ncbi:type II secretion system minor pseudopilin GspK [Sphingosinicella soli]|uniref:Type II secretion system protein K n=1 Tax=Sphingosinicella soli TaxID=333708 RepID=A0A7W7B0U1_9SPHN|nr:type II secretion system minor pseudopilin GspK [Sphingosinicella soli]MBB4631921.1 general secretion pathway protein K [Sphingosinicella soli]
MRERGMALLTVLMLVAVMGALTATALETINRSVRMAGNSRVAMQARYYVLGAEVMALERIATLVGMAGERMPAGGWNGREFTFPTPDDTGTIRARVSDGGNCFNLNSVTDGASPTTLRARPRGIAQFSALMTTLGISDAEARRAAASLADWVDGDSSPLPLGGEDEAYMRLSPAYRTGNTLLAEVSELRAVAGITPEIYEVVRPWVCALPTTELSPINVNTLEASQAPLLTMILPGRLSPDAARQVMASRPAGGWTDVLDFWEHPALVALSPASEELDQVKLVSRWFALEVDVDLSGYTLTETALLDVSRDRARVAERRWTVEE